MPLTIDLDAAIGKWQARHGERMTYTRLAEEAEITLASLNRLKNAAPHTLMRIDARKINAICKVLECEPGDLIKRQETAGYTDATLDDIEVDARHAKRYLASVEEANRQEPDLSSEEEVKEAPSYEGKDKTSLKAKKNRKAANSS